MYYMYIVHICRTTSIIKNVPALLLPMQEHCLICLKCPSSFIYYVHVELCIIF